MPAKTLKPHDGTVIGKPRPGDTASMVGFLRPVVQKTDTTKTYTAKINPIKEPALVPAVQIVETTKAKPNPMPSKTDTIKIDAIKPNVIEQTPTKPIAKPEPIDNSVITEDATQRYIHVDGQPPIKVYEPIARMGEEYAKLVHDKDFKVGDFVEIRENGVILDSGEISMVCVDMYFVETKKMAPRFWFGNRLEKVRR